MIRFALLVFISLHYVSSLKAQVKEEREKLLHIHNVYRDEVNIPHMTWSEKLAEDAKEWAIYLAEHNLFQHASSKQRNGNGENVWRGTHNYFSPTQMVETWGKEKKYYKYGKIGRKINRKKVTGHYTQIVWEKTTQVGCAVATTNDKVYDILVCRYSPVGNIIGEFPY